MKLCTRSITAWWISDEKMFAIPTLTLTQDIRKNGMEAALKYYQDSKIDKVRVDMLHDGFFWHITGCYMVSMWFLCGFCLASMWFLFRRAPEPRVLQKNQVGYTFAHLTFAHPTSSHLSFVHPASWHLTSSHWTWLKCKFNILAT